MLGAYLIRRYLNRVTENRGLFPVIFWKDRKASLMLSYSA